MQPTSVSVPVPGYQRESDPASLRLAGRRPRTFSQALERPMMARIDRLDHLQGSPLCHLPLEDNEGESDWWNNWLAGHPPSQKAAITTIPARSWWDSS